MKKFTADFETSTPEWLEQDEKARVWAWGVCEIGNCNNITLGNNIDDFFKFISNPKENYELYFHNLKFDGEYIFYYLLTHGFKCIEDKKDIAPKTFTTLISDMGQFYTIEIYFDFKNKRKPNKVKIYDSMKILNFSVDKIAKDFKLEEQKLELDYKTYREEGHILTPHECEYLKHDIVIMSKALDFIFKKGLTKMTIGSNALADFKKSISNFDSYFPILTEKDELIRQSYRGGWVYLNPIYKEKLMEHGIVLDKNSMYPSQQYYEYLPYGDPIYFKDEYVLDKCYPLYIQLLSCSFKIKPGKLPTIQLKNTPGFLANEYIEDTHEEIITLCLTSVDLELFMRHYDIKDVVYHGGFKFKRIKGLFKNYIDYWMNEKINAEKEENGALRATSKVMLNSLYGKLGLNPHVRGKYPVLEGDVIKYKMYEAKMRDPIYCAAASFITAYARYDIITTSQKIRDYTLEKYGKDYYIYSDTDSIKCLELSIDELKQFMEIDDYKLGAYKCESKWRKAKFLRQKCYIEEDYEGNIHSTIAGMPKKLGKYVNFDNFTKGFSIKAEDKNIQDKKLKFMHVPGGVILADTDFTIK